MKEVYLFIFSEIFHNITIFYYILITKCSISKPEKQPNTFISITLFCFDFCFVYFSEMHKKTER